MIPFIMYDILKISVFFRKLGKGIPRLHFFFWGGSIGWPWSGSASVLNWLDRCQLNSKIVRLVSYTSLSPGRKNLKNKKKTKMKLKLQNRMIKQNALKASKTLLSNLLQTKIIQKTDYYCFGVKCQNMSEFVTSYGCDFIVFVFRIQYKRSVVILNSISDAAAVFRYNVRAGIYFF